MTGPANGRAPSRTGKPTLRARLDAAEQRVSDVEERYALAASAALEGIYEWNLGTGRLLLSERAKAFFDLATGDLTPSAWIARIHPDDYPGYRSAVLRHFKRLTPQLEHEYRILDDARGTRWILDRGIGVRDAAGRVTKVVGALSDITERKLEEISLRRARDEAREALGQQSAVSEILRVMSRSPTDAQPVFDLLAQRAGKLCKAEVAVVSRKDGERIGLAAIDGVSADAVRIVRGLYPMDIRTESVTARVIRSAQVVHVDDVLADPHYALKPFAQAARFRAGLGVPIVRDRRVIGSIFVGRAAPGRFSDRHVELLKAFADQAAIAIENVRLFDELDRKSRELELASRHKSEFLANMSHELRTPLNAIIGFSEVLHERMFGEINDKQAEYLRDILESGRHLLSLINDILDLSKIEAGRMELQPADFHLPTVVDNALILVRERAQRHGIRLAHEADARLGMIRADERKVKQVLLNLLSNALKFTPEGGRVEVRTAVHDGHAQISVVDTGIGIAAEEQAAVFEEFRQVGTAAAKTEGTGLGLAISKKFVELHGGRIWVESRVGTGSTFAFTLPLASGA